jgi:hypothetical protein
VPVVAAQEMRAGSLPDSKRRDRGHRLRVGRPANAVGAEEFTRHVAVFSATRTSLRGAEGDAAIQTLHWIASLRSQ